MLQSRIALLRPVPSQSALRSESLSIAQNTNSRRISETLADGLGKEGSGREMGSGARCSRQIAAHMLAQALTVCLVVSVCGRGDWAPGTSPLPTPCHPQSLLLQHHRPFMVLRQQRPFIECGIPSARLVIILVAVLPNPAISCLIVECDRGKMTTDRSDDANRAQRPRWSPPL